MKKAAIVAAVLGLGVIATGTMLYYQVGKRGEDEIHLLPEGYTGSVFIIFNQPDGQEKGYEDGKRVYIIPPDGILKTQFSPNEGLARVNYYYVNGKRKELEYKFGKEMYEVTDSIKVYVTAESRGVATGDIDRKKYTFMSYIVSSLGQVDSIYANVSDVHVPNLLEE